MEGIAVDFSSVEAGRMRSLLTRREPCEGLTRCRREAEKMIEWVVSFQNAVQEKQSELQVIRRRLEEELRRLQEELNRLQDQLRAVENERNRTVAELNATPEYEEYTVSYTDSDGNTQYETKTRRINVEKIRQLKDDISYLTGEINEIKRKIAEVRRKIEAVMQKIRRVDALIDRCRALIGRANTVKGKISGTIERLENTNRTVVEICNECERRVIRAEQCIEAYDRVRIRAVTVITSMKYIGLIEEK